MFVAQERNHRTEATPLHPWPGETIAVPQYLNGCEVLAAVKLPQDDPLHQWEVIAVNNGRQGGGVRDELILWRVQFERRWLLRDPEYGCTSYNQALLVLLRRVQLEERFGICVDLDQVRLNA